MIDHMVEVFRAQYGKNVVLSRLETRWDAYGESHWAFTTHNTSYRWSPEDGYWERIT